MCTFTGSKLVPWQQHCELAAVYELLCVECQRIKHCNNQGDLLQIQASGLWNLLWKGRVFFNIS
uniref:Uncharacterized protein n=1 Tax=Anguilla anguilla TaxID=7936 RepID=A0A0E9RUV8_ANGAN